MPASFHRSTDAEDTVVSKRMRDAAGTMPPPLFPAHPGRSWTASRRKASELIAPRNEDAPPLRMNMCNSLSGAYQ